MDTDLDDENRRIETLGGGESSTYEVDMNQEQEPREGMFFVSEEAARLFYDGYALRVGFSTRVLSSRKSDRDGSIISRGLGCRGCPHNGRRGGCTATLLLKREKTGGWVVRKFVRDHNHSLVVQLQKSRRTLDEKDKKIQELTAELRVKKRLSAAYREQILTFVKDVEHHNEQLSKRVQLVFKNLGELETKGEELAQSR
ncbi:Protein FAR1-RELATED SEQUENCE like [Quillaja saponaria]|uniref:Protein FAR1-RELATED SEQUENCE like n=1 Tax=Quillaja saponaria TaxID=32244 RepID=A0AAD7VM61_QUISA|nr:Protein FAR1-RELATED SEQUENCE like [Quillaja saponaria]